MSVDAATPKARFSICLLENSHNELLFLRRAKSASLGSDQWGFPAGHIEPQENARQCAEREISEEIGSSHKIELLQSLPPVRDLFYGGVYDIYLFHYRWIAGEIELNDEHSDYRWVGQSEFRALDTVLGIDEDIFYLKIWPIEFLDPDKIPT